MWQYEISKWYMETAPATHGEITIVPATRYKGTIRGTIKELCLLSAGSALCGCWPVESYAGVSRTVLCRLKVADIDSEHIVVKSNDATVAVAGMRLKRGCAGRLQTNGRAGH